MKYFLEDEGSSNICGYRPTGYNRMPRFYLMSKPPPSSCCTTFKRNKSKKSKGKEPLEVIEVLGPSRFTDASTSYILTTNPSFTTQKRCVPVHHKPSKNRTVSVQKVVPTEQRSNQFPSNPQCQPTSCYPKRSVTVTEQEPKIKTNVETLLSQTASQTTETKNINGQFPCPCLSPDLRNDGKMCDAIFYSWWGRQMAKDREAARLAREMAAKRYALSYPDEAYPASGFVSRCRQAGPVQEEYPEKLIKEEVYENQYKAPKQAYFFASPPKDLKQEKRWSFVKTLNNAFKTITTRERRSFDDSPLCKCGERLNICGPEYKRCGGIEGVLIPCGFNCDCRNTKECMEGYLHSLCPCEKPCKCPRDLKRMVDRRSPPPPQQDYRGSLALGRTGQTCFDPETTVQQKQFGRHLQYQEPEVHHGFSDTAIVKKAKAEKDSCREERRCCSDEAKAVARSLTEESVKIKYMPQKHVSDSDDCCCSCDEELCECCCCRGLAVTKKGIQTSRFCFRENCTQTEKARKKCCRCCRCCGNRGKKDCDKCMVSAGAQNDTCGGTSRQWDNSCGGASGHFGSSGAGVANPGASAGHFSSGCHPESSGYPDRRGCCDKGGVPQDNTNGYTNSAATETQEPRTSRNEALRGGRSGTKHSQRNGTRSAPARAKTLMVRTNSIQCCLPTQENKSTNCDYADTISASRIDRFIAELYGRNHETVQDPFRMQVDNGNLCKHGGDFQERTFELNAEDINKLTKAKLQNYFLDGDVYLSPVSGKNYDLSYRNIDIPTKIASTKLLKPLDVNEQLTHSQISAHCFTSEGEHVKLMTSICEAILSTNQNNGEIIEEPTKEMPTLKPLKEKNAEILHTITEDNEPSLSNSSKNIIAVDAASGPQEEPQSPQMNQKLIDEIQQNFKDKIDKLEEKIDKLIHDANDNESKPKLITPKPRSQSPAVLSFLNKQRNKSKPEHKPVVTKTGLFGVLPTRSQVFNNYNRKTIDNQQGDTKLEKNLPAKTEDESIARYETLLEGNQKHVDDLLLQLEVLHNRNATLDESNLETERKDVCCLQNTVDVAYKPDLGTGENFMALDEILKLSSPNKLYNQISNLFPGDERGERVFCLNDIEYYNQEASTSASPKQLQSTLDFSNVVFTKPPVLAVDNKDISSVTAANSNSLFTLSSPNFILDNLQSYTTSISDSFTVEKLLNKDYSSSQTVESLFAKIEGCSDDSNISVCNVDLNCKNKV